MVMVIVYCVKYILLLYYLYYFNVFNAKIKSLVCVWIEAFAFKPGSRTLFTGLTKLFFNKLFIKNRSHIIIHTFKNYFVTVFSVFSNKRYPNRPLMLCIL